MARAGGKSYLCRRLSNLLNVHFNTVYIYDHEL